MNIPNRILRHLNKWKENYILIPGIIIVIILILHFVGYLTGRASQDSPTALVGFIYNTFGIVIAISLTGFVQSHFFGYRSEKEGSTIWDDIYDGFITLALLALFLFSLWH